MLFSVPNMCSKFIDFEFYCRPSLRTDSEFYSLKSIIICMLVKLSEIWLPIDNPLPLTHSPCPHLAISIGLIKKKKRITHIHPEKHMSQTSTPVSNAAWRLLLS